MLTYLGHQTKHANEPKRVVLAPILRSLPVIISFMCQLEWPWIAQVQHYFWEVRAFLDEFELVDSEKEAPLTPVWVGILQSIGMNTTTDRRRTTLPFFLLYGMSWDISSYLLLWAIIYTISSGGSQTFGLRFPQVSSLQTAVCETSLLP